MLDERGIMKTNITQTVTACDACEKPEAFYACLNCHKDYCWKCVDTEGVNLKHATWASGSGDIFFCSPCYAKPRPENKPILRAYEKIAALRAECKSWNDDFTKRREEAEAEAKSLYVRYGKP